MQNSKSLQKSIQISKQDEVNVNPKMLRSFWPRCARSSRLTAKTAIIMRSAERVDRVFGSSWLNTERSEDAYNATDLNVPTDLLPPSLFSYNPPITNIGKYSSQVVGRALQNRGLAAKTILCSPTLRSIQTASAIAKVMNIKISIEPGLLEPLEWYRKAGSVELPNFSLETLIMYPIERNYKPIHSMEDLKKQYGTAKQADCVSRIQMTLQSLCGASNESAVVIVAHALTMEIASQMGTFGDRLHSSNADEENDEEYTSYEVPDYKVHEDCPAQKLELGVKYPPGSTLGLARCNHSPPYVFRLIDDALAPLTTTKFSTRVIL
ncbi:unnamed protein product [Caenorhabditis auriculariae]|uniref:Phosphoglycerate mutase family protein n=1 Tax=Caenorhabditis auriculariae TaxID=2777116 RepID=A0A8S1GSW3_9PELO|nr:unnamed protein product [Caenorhabditis auriculariae]